MKSKYENFQSLEINAAQISNHWKFWAIACLIAMSGCGHKVEPGRTQTENGIPLPANAQTVAVAMGPYREKVDVMGTVASAARAQISAKLSANIDRVFVTAGQAVTNGELLVKLDDRELRTQLAAAQAQFSHADTELRRVEKLLEGQAATEQMRSAADAAVMGAKAQMERAMVALSWAEIRSPMNGVVADKQVDDGDLANPGQPLLSVYDPKHLRLEVAVPARLIPLLPLGADVSVTLENPARDAKGRVEVVVSEADQASRTQTVKVHLDDASDLRPGQFGRLWVELPPRDAIFVPQAAIYRSGQLEFVQVVADGRAKRRLVKTGRSDGARVEIVSGLNVGEKILAQPVM